MGSKETIIAVLASLVFVFTFTSLCEGRLTSDTFQEFAYSSTSSVDDNGAKGTKWALLIAGSSGYENYRHQADICHAYHIMKKGGLKDENIIVFMYDDIAYNEENPRKGVILNRPYGPNLYPGVPKDYTGEAVNSSNVLAAILGDKTAIKGGSGKVLNTGPNDHIFIYYADHGGPGILGMPEDEDLLYAKDLIHVLKKKHASKSYKKMVIYVEACESGSIFDGLLPKHWNIYAVTASNPSESSYATYCPDDTRKFPKPYITNYTCFGDLFSISWMEDSDKRNPSKESLEKQYIAVRNRTASSTEGESSHVMQYGDRRLSKDLRALYMVAKSTKGMDSLTTSSDFPSVPMVSVEQREADLMYFKAKVAGTPWGSNERAEAQRKLDEVLSHRRRVDESIKAIGVTLFGEANGPSLIGMVRPAGQAIVDDWDCFQTMVSTYEAHCGLLRSYGRKHTRAFANFCNAGINKEQITKASVQACA